MTCEVLPTGQLSFNLPAFFPRFPLRKEDYSRGVLLGTLRRRPSPLPVKFMDYLFQTAQKLFKLIPRFSDELQELPVD